MRDGTGQTTYSYDSLGRLKSVSSPGPIDRLAPPGARPVVQALAGHETLGYAYDLAGRLTQTTYPALVGSSPSVQAALNSSATPTVTNSYDPAGRLASIKDFFGGTFLYGHDPDGNTVSVHNPNSTSQQDTYNPDDQLTQRTVSGPTGSILSLPYAYDANGQVTSDTATALTPTVAQTYAYNNTNQLTTATIPLTAGQAITKQQYAYDPAGRVTTTSQLGVPVNLQYDAADQLTTTTQPTTNQPLNTYTSNPDGDRTQQTNTLTGTATSYTYDQANRLVQYHGPPTGTATTTLGSAGVPTSPITNTYSYNGDGLRADLLWDPSQRLPLILADSTGDYYITGPDGLPLEQLDPTQSLQQAVRYYHHDQLGSTRAITGSQGLPLARTDYDPYGNTLHATAVLTNQPVGYAGQYTDPNTGLIYLRARWYDPSTAQFLTQDALESITGEPYAYAQDNPINTGDPSGLIFGIPGTPSAGSIANSVVGGLGQFLNTPVTLPNSRFVTGALNVAYGGFKIATGVGLVAVGTAADLTGIGAALGVPAQAYGGISIVLGVARVVRGFEQYADALSQLTACKTPLDYGADIGLDLGPGRGSVENFLGGLP